MSFYGIIQISIGAAAVFKSKINQEQLMQDLNVEKENNEIKKSKLII